MGFFDVPSGYFSGLVVQVELDWVGHDRLMPATILDAGIFDGNGESIKQLTERGGDE